VPVLALLARAGTYEVLHQALLPNGVDLAIGDRLTERLAQLVGQLLAIDANTGELVVGDALRDFGAVVLPKGIFP
jgi:hypothetical protein